MARRRGKVDTTHGEIRDTLRAKGCTVFSIASVGDDVPDLVAGYRGYDYLIEAKTPKNKKGEPRDLEEGQKKFHESWRGEPIIVAVSGAEAFSEIYKRTRQRQRERKAWQENER